MSLTVSVVVVLLAYPIGYFLALCVRKLKYVLLLVIIVPFLTSYLLRVLAWKVILGERGVVNSALVALHSRPRIKPIEWLLYSQFAVMLVLAYVWIPFVALPIFVSLNNLDRILLEAAGDLGASRLRTFWRVTLPLSLPGLTAAFVFVFVPTIGEFVTPSLVGGTSGYLSVTRSKIGSRGLDWQSGSVLAMFLLIVVAGLMVIFGRCVQIRTVAATDGARDLAWRSGPAHLLRAARGVPLRADAVLVVFSFNKGDSRSRSRDSPSTGTAPAANDILVGGSRRGALRRRDGDEHHRGYARRARLVRPGAAGLRQARVSALVFSPLVIPYLVFGISLLVLFKLVDKVLTQLSGMYIGLGMHAVIIGHVVVALPYTILTILPLLERLSMSLDEAAHDLGASPRETFRRVTFPLLMPALVSAFLIAFTLSFDEYAIASFLAGSQVTWPVFLFAQLRVPSLLPELIAVSSVVFIASMLLVLSAEIGRRLAERRYGSEYTARGLG